MWSLRGRLQGDETAQRPRSGRATLCKRHGDSLHERALAASVRSDRHNAATAPLCLFGLAPNGFYGGKPGTQGNSAAKNNVNLAKTGRESDWNLFIEQALSST